MKVRLSTRIKVLLEDAKTPRQLTKFVLKLSGLYDRGIKNAQDIKLIEHDVIFPHLPKAFDGFRIMFISDMHVDGELDIVSGTLRAIDETKADVLLLGGDYRFLPDAPPDESIRLMQLFLEKIDPSIPVYAVRGNHDEERVMNGLRSVGTTVLENESVTFSRDNENLTIIGIDDPHYFRADNFKAAYKNVPTNAFKIVLIHTAERFKQALYHQTDFYLCGHTHGGQIAHPKYGPLITNTKAPRHMAAGFWQEGNMTGYTSYGVGVSAVPVRLNAPPEVVVFTLKKSKA